MPRLLPRLLKALRDAPNATHVPLARHAGAAKRKSLYRPTPDVAPSFHPAGRTRSMLLDENPVTDKWAFARHKRLPPRVRLGLRPAVHGEQDVPREMTTQEREWSSSPYLRMLASPLRQCTLSKRYLPNDFLVRLAVLRSPATQNAASVEVLVPDGLEHPKYKPRRARVAVYTTCWKQAVGTMRSPVSLPSYGANIYFSKYLCAHISYLLRLRVLQELEILIGDLRRNRGRLELDADADPTILRRLTRSELKTVRQTGIIPYPDAVAVLVVPPVNRDPKTMLRPRPSREPEIPPSESDDPADITYKKSLLPLSSLHYVMSAEDTSEQGVRDSLETPFSTFLPDARIPLYNGLTMFPSPPHRAALHKLLKELLDVERHFRGAHHILGSRTEEFKRVKGDAKGSHAFLFMSNEQTVKRADTAALAIALWRLRMWEGDAFVDNGQGWEVGKEWRIEQCSHL